MSAMTRNLLSRVASFIKREPSHEDIRVAVNYSVSKYGETYKLLENYDPTTERNTEMVSQRRDVQEILQRVQRSY